MDAKKSLNLNPLWIKPYYTIGCYLSLNKCIKAIKILDKVLARDPTNQEIKTLRDTARYENTQTIYTLLDQRFEPTIDRTHFQHIFNSTLGLSSNTSHKTEDEIKELLLNFDHSLNDIMLANCDRDGCFGYKQDYKLSVKYYEILWKGYQ